MGLKSWVSHTYGTVFTLTFTKCLHSVLLAQLGVRMPIEENGKRPALAGVIHDVLATMAGTSGGSAGGGTEEGGTAPTPSVVSPFRHSSGSQCIQRRLRLGRY